MKQVHFIINPISGTGSKEGIPSMINSLFPSEQYEVHIHKTTASGHASQLTKEALNAGAQYIIAVGGDGTVNEVARTMVHSKAALGIIPGGSGNGLARELGIPIDPKKALEIIALEHVISIDYCTANDHIFFCTCGFGFDALISERFSQAKQRGSLTYIKSVVQEYLKFHSEDYELIIDGVHLKERAFLMTCANASQYGNNAYIAPNANVQDGKMDVVIISPVNPLQVGPLAIQLFTKQINNSNKSQTYQAESVSIIRKKAGVMHVDGDPISVPEQIYLKVFPSGLNVIVPTPDRIQTYLQGQFQDFRSLLREASLWVTKL